MSSVILFIYLVDWEGASEKPHMVRPRVSHFLARGDFHAHSRVHIPDLTPLTALTGYPECYLA